MQESGDVFELKRPGTFDQDDLVVEIIPFFLTEKMFRVLVEPGIIGEYIGKIYMESKGRPRYIVDSMILRDAEDSAEEEQENERKD